MSKVAWMFPSPGAYLPGVLRPVVGEDPELASVLKEIDVVAAQYGWGPVGSLLTDDRGDSADQHGGHLWLGFYATSMVVDRALTASGVCRDVVLGHSGGEVSALVAAGCLSVAEGARVLCERARAVEGAGLVPGAMAVLEAPVRRVAQLCGAIDEGSLTVAVDNGPRQVVVSGAVTGISLLERTADVLQIATTRLQIPDAYHHPRLGAAARRLADSVADIRLRRPLVRTYSPQLGRYIEDAADVRELLEGMLVLPVRFREALTTLHGEGWRPLSSAGPSRFSATWCPSAFPRRSGRCRC
ncbi:acyltransferase domain-containing protein [Streptomyces olivoreticuli]|uniref:ACP S-malonyltransferase n=1 Tax=Streptomyces olivoreticuli TaxID=68246 RepID=UPI002659095E|nr:acyltransferase domain-containing protein [Streptomyces olivoreticuli]WKK26916.1 acyltransferase domain-containing protein [Streptomyces olivoreticuli]